MRYAGAIAILGLCVPSAGAGDGKAGLDGLQGRWRVTSIVAGGQAVGPAKGAPTSLVIKDRKATFFADAEAIMAFKDLALPADQAKGPKAIDLIRDERSVLPCLCDVSGDEFKLAMPMIPEDRKPGELLPRPDSLDSKDKPVMVFTMKRLKD